MRMKHMIAASALLAAAIVSPAFGQQPTRPGTQPARPSATPTPATQPPAANLPVPDAKVALINTAAFADEKAGIARVLRAIRTVEAEFDPQRKDLQALQNRINALTEEIPKLKAGQGTPGNPVSPRDIALKEDQLEQLKRDYQRKGEDGQTNYQKRLNALMAPIQDDIFKSLEAFSKARGITLMLDASQIPQAIIYITDAVDVTRAFIAEYNSKNPATASAPVP